jgi:hypothetical protein
MSELSRATDSEIVEELRRRYPRIDLDDIFSESEIERAADNLGILDDAREEGADDVIEEALAQASDSALHDNDDVATALSRLRGGDIPECLLMLGRALTGGDNGVEYYAFHGLDATVERYYRSKFDALPR